MAAPHDDGHAGQRLVQQLEDICLADQVGRKTVRLGGVSAHVLTQILTDSRAVWHRRLTDEASVEGREVATMRMVVIDEVLGQLAEVTTPDEIVRDAHATTGVPPRLVEDLADADFGGAA